MKDVRYAWFYFQLIFGDSNARIYFNSEIENYMENKNILK